MRNRETKKRNSQGTGRNNDGPDRTLYKTPEWFCMVYSLKKEEAVYYAIMLKWHL